MTTPSGLFLWARPGPAAPLTPESLAASHPLWAAEAARRAPWTPDGPLWAASGTAGLSAPVIVCGECGSSLDAARDLAGQDFVPEWGAVLAVSQTSGRGQLRRPWVSPPGNLYAAWRWPSLSRVWDPLAPLAAGLLAAETLDGLGMDVRIKWPNDLLDATGRKVGGILVEERGGVVFVGMGLNLFHAPPDAEIREQWSPRAACLSPFGDAFSVISLWAGLVDRARNWYASEACSDDPRAFLARLTRRVAWLGRRVRVLGGEGEYLAVPVGLAEDGGLVLDRSGRRSILYSGSISPA